MTVASVQNERSPDPKKVTVQHYQKLLTLSTNQRKSYYRFLQTSILTELNATVKLDIKRSLDAQKTEKMRYRSGHINYEYNKIFHRISDQEVLGWKDRK